MYSDESFIGLYRKLSEWEYYKNLKIKSVFIHCLLKANWTAKKFEGITVERGQFVTSLETFSRDNGMSIQEVRTALKKLQNSGCIEVKSTNKYTLITVIKYGVYQTIGENLTNEQQTTNNQLTTTNNINNNNKKEYIYMSEVKQIFDLYNSICSNMPNANKLTEARIKSIHARFCEHKEMVFFENYFKRVNSNSFLTGSSGWKANLDWLMKPSNMIKVLEGNYDNNKPKKVGGDKFDDEYYEKGF